MENPYLMKNIYEFGFFFKFLSIIKFNFHVKVLENTLSNVLYINKRVIKIKL